MLKGISKIISSDGEQKPGLLMEGWWCQCQDQNGVHPLLRLRQLPPPAASALRTTGAGGCGPTAQALMECAGSSPSR